MAAVKDFGRLTLCILLLTSVGQAETVNDSADAVEQRALEVVKKMSAYLTGMKSFTFKGEDAFDEMLPSGQKVQFSNRRTVTVVRPNQVTGEYYGDTANRKVWYDGKTFAILNAEENVYSAEEVPGTIDSLIEFVTNRFGVDFPLSDFISKDPYQGLTEHVKTGVHLGMHGVGGVPCHHLAFTQDELDWQLWIEEGSKPLPRKLVITYKQETGQPQYAWVFQEWAIVPSVSAEAFHFVPPDGAERIEMLPAKVETAGPDGDKQDKQE